MSCTAVLQPTSPYGQPCFWHTVNGAESQPWCNPALLCIRSDACGGHRTDAGPGAKLKLPHSASNTDYPKLTGKLFSRIKLLKKRVIAGLYLLYSKAIYFIFAFTYWQLLLFWVNVLSRAYSHEFWFLWVYFQHFPISPETNAIVRRLLTGAVSEVEYSQMSSVWSHFPIRLSAYGDCISYPSNMPCVALNHWCLIHRISHSRDSLWQWLCSKGNRLSSLVTEKQLLSLVHHLSKYLIPGSCSGSLPCQIKLFSSKAEASDEPECLCLTGLRLSQVIHLVKSSHPPFLSAHHYLFREVMKYQSTRAATGGVWGGELRFHLTWLW